jgi:YVTN family beta-propeller protein
MLFLLACGDSDREVSTSREYVYVANEGADVVSVVDAGADTVVATIPVGQQPTSVAIQPGGARAYVANAEDIRVIDTARNTVVGTIPSIMIHGNEPPDPWQPNPTLAFPVATIPSPDGTILYVTGEYTSGCCNDYESHSVLATVDPSSLSVISTTAVDGCSTVAAIAPDGRTLYAASSTGCSFGFVRPANTPVTVSALAADTVTVTASADLPLLLPASLTTNRDGTRLYVVGSDDNGRRSVVVLNAATLEVITSVGIDTASEIAFAPDGSRTYVRTTTGVAVLDPTTLAVRATIPTGSMANGLAISPGGERVYVTDAASYSLAVIDTASNTVSTTVPLRAHPHGLAAVVLDHAASTPTPRPTPGPAQVCAYVTLYQGGVAIVNTDTHRVTGGIPVGGGQIALAPDGTFAYVPRGDWNDVAVIDTGTQSAVAEIPLGGGPDQLILSPDGRFAYAPIYLHDIAVVDLARRVVAGTIPTDGYIYAMAVAPTGSVYATTQVCPATGTGSCRTVVLVIDTAAQRIIGSIDVDNWSTEQLLAVSPDGTRLYGISWTRGSGYAVSILDTVQAKVVNSIPLLGGAYALALHPDGKTLYALEQQVTVIDPMAGVVVATLPVSGESMAFTPDGTYGYLGGWHADGSGAVFVIDTRSNTVEAEVSTGNTPTSIAIGTVRGGCTDPSL